MAAMEAGNTVIDGITDVDTANAAVEQLGNLDHALTSRRELGAKLNRKIKELGLFYDKVLKRYTLAPEAPKEAE